jgi:hypothetical protein
VFDLLDATAVASLVAPCERHGAIRTVLLDDIAGTLWALLDSPAALRLFRHSTKMYVIQLVDCIIHERCDDARSLCVHHRIFALRVQQNFVQALLHGVGAHELCSFCGDRLFKSALRSLMIRCKHVILLGRVACQAFGGVSAPSDAACSRPNVRGFFLH